MLSIWGALAEKAASCRKQSAQHLGGSQSLQSARHTHLGPHFKAQEGTLSTRLWSFPFPARSSWPTPSSSRRWTVPQSPASRCRVLLICTESIFDTMGGPGPCSADGSLLPGDTGSCLEPAWVGQQARAGLRSSSDTRAVGSSCPWAQALNQTCRQLRERMEHDSCLLSGEIDFKLPRHTHLSDLKDKLLEASRRPPGSPAPEEERRALEALGAIREACPQEVPQGVGISDSHGPLIALWK